MGKSTGTIIKRALITGSLALIVFSALLFFGRSSKQAPVAATNKIATVATPRPPVDREPQRSGNITMTPEQEEWRKEGGTTIFIFVPSNSQANKAIKDSIAALQSRPNWSSKNRVTITDTSAAIAPFAAKTGSTWPVIYLVRPSRQSMVRGMEYLSLLPIISRDIKKDTLAAAKPN